MSKIITNEVQSKTTNGDLSITPNGTGVFEVTAENSDGVLQLNDAQQTNSVKIKAPPDSASQDHTLILPNNQIAADKYLQVASVTGSGATAVGQLEFATVTPPATTLDANNLTSGTIPTARLPASLPATGGHGFQLTHNIALSSAATTISATGFEDDAVYHIFGVNLLLDGNEGTYGIELLDSAGSAQNQIKYSVWDDYNNGRTDYSSASDIRLNGGLLRNEFHLEMEVYTKADTGWVMFNGFQRGTSRFKGYASFGSGYSKRIHGIKLTSISGYTYQIGSQILIYKYVES